MRRPSRFSPHLSILSVLSVLSVLPGCSIEQRPANDRRVGDGGGPVRDTILAELRQYYADLSARDWKRFADHFWTGATLTTRWQPPGEKSPRVVETTVPEFVAQAPRGPGSRQIFEERMLSAEVKVYRDLAQVWARYQAKFGDPGDVAEWQGTDAFTLMRHDGRWRIAALVFTRDTEHPAQ